jgi:hypothetical protein
MFAVPITAGVVCTVIAKESWSNRWNPERLRHHLRRPHQRRMTQNEVSVQGAGLIRFSSFTGGRGDVLDPPRRHIREERDKI